MGPCYWSWYASGILYSIYRGASKLVGFTAVKLTSKRVGCTADRPQDSTLAPQPAVPNASVPQSTGPTNVAVPTNVSASGPTYHQQNLAMLIQPKSPTEVLMSRSPHGNGVTWIFHDPTTSFVHHVNVPCIHPVAQ